MAKTYWVRDRKKPTAKQEPKPEPGAKTDDKKEVKK